MTSPAWAGMLSISDEIDRLTSCPPASRGDLAKDLSRLAEEAVTWANLAHTEGDAELTARLIETARRLARMAISLVKEQQR